MPAQESDAPSQAFETVLLTHVAVRPYLFHLRGYIILVIERVTPLTMAY